MRFLYYDKIVEIEKGRRIKGLKSFALSEEFMRGHFSRKALVPGVILIEAMAQVLGWLTMFSNNFRISAVMTIIEGVSVPPALKPGVTVEIHGEIISTSRRDSLGRAWITLDGQTIASLDRIIYSHFPKVDTEYLIRLFSYYSGMEREEILRQMQGTEKAL
jgi:3-hydroxyacyl-[acyl-carrier-protein] dehydratase